MRLTVIILSCSFLFVSCFNNATTNYGINAEKAFLKISLKTTKAELLKISQQFLDEKNIIVDFSMSTFDEEGFIQDVDLSVDCNDGMKGTATGSRALLRFTSIGFVRDYRADSARPFSIGGDI